jgi:cyclic pyranopterin phosphate synthase
MVKAVDPAATMTDVQLIEKTGGKHGRWTRDERAAEPEPVRAGGARVLVVSTGAAAGTRTDTTGARIASWLRAQGLETPEPTVVADADVAEGLRAALQDGPEVLVTTGGTGPSPTDRTPEATAALLDRPFPGISEALRARAGTPTAALGRGVAGLANGTVVVNLPGSTGGVDDGLAVLADLLPHLRHQIRGEADHAHGAHQSTPHEAS